MSEKQIIRIDASALRESLCWKRFHDVVVKGYTGKVNTNDVEWGTAFHLFMKRMHETGGNLGIAMHESIDYYNKTPMEVKYDKQYLTTLYLQTACLDFWQWCLRHDDSEIILGADGKPSVEVTFDNKVYEDDNYIVNFCGTMDKLVKIRNGPYAIGDYKTTAARDKDNFLDGFLLKTQLKFYLLNLHLYAKNNPDSLIAEVCRLPVGCFIDGVFHQGAAKTVFERSEVFMFKPDVMTRYKAYLNDFLASFLARLRTNDFPANGLISDACDTNFGCRFKKVCGASDSVIAQAYIDKAFIIKPYNPLLFGKAA